MKKLTAGIFASILGLTAMGAADAAVTSKQYVDNAIEAAKTAVTESIAGDYATTEALAAETNARTQADNGLQQSISDVADDVLLKQDKLQGAMIVKEGTGNVVSEITAANGVITYQTTAVATSEGLGDLQARVSTIEGDYVTEGELDASELATKNAYEAADTTTLQAAKDYADTKAYSDAEVRGLISGNTSEINTIKGEQTQQDIEIQNLKNAGYATEQWVTNKDYATKAEAQGYADAKDTAISAAQTTANEAKSAASVADGKAVSAQTTADEAAAAAAAAAKISTQKGNDGVYVLTATVAGDSTTYKWEVITRNGTETDETTVTPALPEDGE